MVEGRLWAIPLRSRLCLSPDFCLQVSSCAAADSSGHPVGVGCLRLKGFGMAWAFAQLACRSEGLGHCAAGLTSDPSEHNDWGAHVSGLMSPSLVEAGACAPTSGRGCFQNAGLGLDRAVREVVRPVLAFPLSKEKKPSRD